jgi:hypothetical protein
MTVNRMRVFWAGIVLSGLFAQTPVAAQDTLQCEDVLYAAEKQFFNARFEEASHALEACLNAYIFQKPELLRAKILLARIYFAARQELQAWETLEEILHLDADYRAVPPLPPPFIALVDDVRSAEFRRAPYADRLKPAPILEKEKDMTRPWVWIVGGALVAGTAVALLSGGSESGFPPPPGPPGR